MKYGTTTVSPSALLTRGQEELMFEAISNPIKGKGKAIQDVGKRRAYVRLVTSLGGSLNLELFCEKVCATNSALHQFDVNPGTQNMLQLPHACQDRQVR